jgi:hypothetical protein
MARLAITAREVAGPQLSPVPQSESWEHTSSDVTHMRMGPGVPCELGTQVSVELTGPVQVLAAGMVQVLLGVTQVLLVLAQVLVFRLPQVAAGRLHTSGVPTVHPLTGGGTQVPPQQS